MKPRETDKVAELIGGPFDGSRLASGAHEFVMIIHYDLGRDREAVPYVYQRKGGVFVFQHNATTNAQEGYANQEGEDDDETP